MADLYRKSSLEKISNPEQLDKVLVVTSPMSWLALIAVTVIVVIALTWSIVGTIPETVTAKGIVSAPVGSNAVYVKDSGTVVSVRVRPGTEVHLGDPVLIYQDSAHENHEVLSDQVGTVAELVVKMDDKLTNGSQLIRVTPSIPQSPQMVVCYVPLANAKKLQRGMEVSITLDSLDGQSYGNMKARIVNIDAYATTSEGMSRVIGSGNNLESTFTKDGAVIAVACELYTDSSTVSGYFWTTAKGGKQIVSNGSLVTAKIITDKVPPITKLFSKLRDLWGD